MFTRGDVHKSPTLNLTGATAQDLGSALDRAGVPWSFDDEGDICIRVRSTEQPWIDAVFYEFKRDFSIRGQFLNARAVPQGNGTVRWDVPFDSGHQPTAVAQKVVTVYLIPRLGGVEIQIDASIAPLDRPMHHIRVIPGSQQVRRIEGQYAGFVGTQDDNQFCMASAVGGTDVDETEFQSLIDMTAQIGLAMFDGPFTGWVYETAV